MKHGKCKLLDSAKTLHNRVVTSLETDNVFLKDLVCTYAKYCMVIFEIVQCLEKHN